MPAHTKNMGCFSYDVSIDATATIAIAEAAARDAVAELGDYIKAESNAIAPLREGTLIENSRVEVEGDTATIGYFNTIYANYQHEGVELNHPNGRQAKYLESVMESPATANAAREILAQKLRDRLGG